MSLFDLLGKKYAKGAADWWNAEAGPPPPKKAKGKGFVFPGHNYLGPGNDLDSGKPVDTDDAAAKKHDESYDEQLKQGDNPYVKYNHADAQLQEDLKDVNTFEANLAKGLFQAKKRVLEPLGLVENDSLAPGRKRPATQDSDIDSTVKSQKIKEEEFDPEEIDRIEAANAAATGTGSSAPSGVGDITMSGGGGAPMDNNQQGADGVGNASGNWHCDSQWMGNRVVTHSTRTWVLPSYNDHIYRQINSGSEADNGNRYVGYSTPWGYFDFNRFHCHFSPRDWQRLVNNHWGFRPKSLRVKLFNIQVKEWVNQDGTNVVTNNLTSTVQVFTDDEYQLPYVLGNATEGCLPAFPPTVFTLPQYGYASLNEPGSTDPTDRSAFFCLEYFPSQMLRTGNNFEFSYSFEDVPFHTGWAPSQHLMKTANPLVDQYLYQLTGTDSTGVPQFNKVLAGKYREAYKNWMTGSHRRTQAWNLNGTNNRPNVSVLGNSNFTIIEGSNYKTQPEPAGMTNNLNGDDNVALANSMIFNPQPTAPGTTTTLPPQNVLVTKEDETQPVNSFAAQLSGYVQGNQQNAQSAPNGGTQVAYQGIYPGSVWMDRDVYLHGPIWAKIPNTGAHFHPSPMMGGFGLKHPPPMILMKNTPVPGVTQAFSEVPANNFINQYSTGQVTVSIEWEIQKENSKRWNPEIQYTNNYTDPTFVDFAPDTNGEYRTTRSFGTRWLTRPL